MRTARLPLALLAASMACSAGLAQPGPGVPAQPAAKNGPRGVQVLSVEFPGGTLAQFVDAVKGATTETLNVVVPADAMNLSVPALSLKNVSPYMALQSLEYINQRAAWASMGPQGAQGLMNLNEIKVEDLNRSEQSPFDSARTFAIVYTKRDRGAQGLRDTPELVQTTQVFTVRDLLATGGKDGAGLPGLTLDQIVQPIETTLTVESEDARAQGVEPARLMVHKESNLVIVKGNARQNALVKQVLERLKEDVDRTRSEVLPERERVKLVEELRRQYAVRQSTLGKQRAEAGERVIQLRESLDKAAAAKDERAEAAAQSALRQVEATIATLETMLDQARQQQEEAEFEGTRRWREMGNNSSVAEVRALREQMDLLKKQLEELKAAVRPGNPR